MIMHPAPVSTRNLTYTIDDFTGKECFVGDISDLGPAFRFGQVYDDACDLGMTLISERTGAEVVFALEHTEHPVDGDLLWWVLRGVTKGYKHLTIKLFND